MEPAVTGVAGWRVWYKGGAVHDSASTQWDQLPTTGVLFVMLYLAGPRGPTRRQMSGSDLYFCQPTQGDSIYGSLGYDSLRDAPYVRTRYANAVVLEGEWADDAEFSLVNVAAMASTAP